MKDTLSIASINSSSNVSRDELSIFVLGCSQPSELDPLFSARYVVTMTTERIRGNVLFEEAVATRELFICKRLRKLSLQAPDIRATHTSQFHCQLLLCTQSCSPLGEAKPY